MPSYGDFFEFPTWQSAAILNFVISYKIGIIMHSEMTRTTYTSILVKIYGGIVIVILRGYRGGSPTAVQA